jgi:hypothetical protein
MQDKARVTEENGEGWGERGRPLIHRSCLARDLPCMAHCRELDLKVGTTSVRMGMGGRYLATRLAVRPEEAYTMICKAGRPFRIVVGCSICRPRHWCPGMQWIVHDVG